VIRLTPGMPPSILVTKGQQELAAAIAHYRVKSNHTKKAYQFAVYKSAAVVQAINKLFAYKCAYCESSYGPTQPVDVEHYRPKAKVEEGRKKLLGYYWLAASWENLLPSCIDCNRRRKHELPDGRVMTIGKGNQFPISNPAKRATKPGEEEREKPLLLHPYLDDPSAHLEFTDDGMVFPRAGSRKGRASIDVLALIRPLLIGARRERATLVIGTLMRLRTIAKGMNDDPRNATLQRLFREGVAELDHYMKPDQPYSAMATQLIRQFKAQLF
jgi:5-methylcytosine-specific restriction endonuclease McrA